MNSPKPRKNHNNATLTIRLPEAILAQLTTIADAQYKTASVAVREEIIKYIQQNSIFLTTQAQPQVHGRKPMSAQEYKLMREQEMRGASYVRPQSPSNQNPLVQLTPDEMAEWD
jgi:predicted DNA-binding protein